MVEGFGLQGLRVKVGLGYRVSGFSVVGLRVYRNPKPLNPNP